MREIRLAKLATMMRPMACVKTRSNAASITRSLGVWPVGNDDAAHLVAALFQVGDVGDDQVDAQHRLLGEHEAAVDHDDVVAVLEGHHILADLFKAAQRDGAQFRLCQSSSPAVSRQAS